MPEFLAASADEPQIGFTQFRDILSDNIPSESFCLEQLTSYEAYIIFPGPDDVAIGGIDQGKSNRNSWDRVQIKPRPCLPGEIIQTIRNFDTRRRSIASKLADLYSNQRKHVDNIVHDKLTKEREISFTWALAQLHCNEVRNVETKRKETVSITVYIKRVPLSGIDVISLYRERLKRALSKQGQQQMVTSQDTDQGKQDLVDIYNPDLYLDPTYDVVPRNYDNQERIGSMPLVSLYDSNQQDQRNTGISSYWSAPERDILLQSDSKQASSSEEQSLLLTGAGGAGYDQQVPPYPLLSAPQKMPPALPRRVERMQRTESTNNNVSSSSAYRSRPELLRHNQLATNHKLAPRGNSDDDESQAISTLLYMKSKAAEEDRLVAPISKTPYQRPKHERLFCDLCDDIISFHSAHELSRHKGRHHTTIVTKWVCIEPLDGIKDEFRPINPLAKCKACNQQNKKYGDYYNAAAHLRRAHFVPKPRRRNESGKVDDKSEKRGVMRGGDWPPMKELKRWMTNVYVRYDEVQQDGDVEWIEGDVLADLDESTNMATAPSNPMSFDHTPLVYTPLDYTLFNSSPLYPADKSTDIDTGPPNLMSFDNSHIEPSLLDAADESAINTFFDGSHFYRANESTNMADDPSNPMSFDHNLLPPADNPMIPYSPFVHSRNLAEHSMSPYYPFDNRVHRLEWPKLEYPIPNGDRLEKPYVGGLSTGSRSPKEQEPEHSLQESRLKEHAKPMKEPITAMDEIVVEGPFTDSGYASILKTNISRNDLPLADKPQCPVADKSNVKMGNEDTEDTKTIYSAAASIDLPQSQQYITELCGDIFNKLENHFDSTNWNTLEKRLPSLIKAFAVKIGYDSSAQVNQDIMYFIHKQHRGIISHLKTMFCREDDEQPNSRQSGPKGMSLVDKMSMWDKSSEIDTISKNDEFFEGVRDDDDEITDEVGLSTYHGIVLKSPSYEWLLSSLRNEFSLQWGSRQPRIMVENIRQKILDKLPTGTISKRRPLKVCRVTFGLQLDNTTDRGNGLIAKLMTSEILLSKLITVTGCQEESQALTIEQYLRQTWPAYGVHLFNVLQETIDHFDNHYSVILPGNTQFDARISSSSFIITATGPAQFIAECAEQLAWLQAALLSSTQNLAGYYAPSIEKYEVRHSRSKQLKYRGSCDFAVDFSPLLAGVIPQKQSWWQDLFGKKNIIQGFPISRRPEAYPGLELSFELLLSLVQTNGVVVGDGLVLLKGPISTLQLLNDTNDVFLWKPFHQRNGICFCGDYHMEISLNIPYSSFNLRRLKTGRHILGVCKDLLAMTAENSEGMCKKSRLPETNDVHPRAPKDIAPVGNLRSTAYNLNAIGPNDILSPPPGSQGGENDSRPSVSNQVDCSIPKTGLPLYTENPKGHLLLDDQTTSIADSLPNSTMPSQDESLDSDMLSISDSSEQFELPENNAAINAFINDVVNHLLSGFRRTTQGQFSQAASGSGEQPTTQSQVPSGNRGQSTTQAAATEPSTTSRNLGRSQKKRCAPDGDDYGDQDGSRKRPIKKPRHDPEKRPPISFACPYLKINPVKHGKCCAFQLTRIQDVKQHLTRIHTPERYCQRCLASDFCDEPALQDHLDLNTCPRNDPTSLEGISNKQHKELSRKSKTGIGKEEQWFAIWEILFAGCARPRSVYMDTEVSMELRLFRDYCDTREADVVRGLYEADPVWSGESTVEQRQAFVQMVFAQGMNRVFEDYRRSLESMRSGEQSGDGMQPVQSETPLSLFADSGIAVGSQSSPREVSSRGHVPSQSPPQDISSPRDIPSQSSPRDISSRRQVPSQSPPQDINTQRHVPSQSSPQGVSFQRHFPSQPPAVFDNGGPSASTANYGSSQSQIPSQAPPVFGNGGPGAWTEQDGVMQMSQGADVDLLNLSDDLFNFDGFDSSGLDLDDYFNEPIGGK
ncbi:hypothetical protein VE03_02433 [Pseudogymnoascus sp. 23342-1-I1]|nr:hypothetical protein VE03_02433 [Pseudogymnoascus sp. 23342-1-I1]